jgi:phosphatidylglycerophosphatase C
VRLLQVVPVLLAFACGRADRGALKSSAIRAVMAGYGRSEIERWTQEFVPNLLEHGMLVLLSASPDLYVPAIGRALGFAKSLCTGVRWESDRLDGRLTTPNRRDVEKTHCVTALRHEHPGLRLVAYGNAASDLEHLALVDRATLVNGSATARRAAAGLNIDCVTWR